MPAATTYPVVTTPECLQMLPNVPLRGTLCPPPPPPAVKNHGSGEMAPQAAVFAPYTGDSGQWVFFA